MSIQEGPPPARGETLLETRIPSRLEMKTPLAVRVTSEVIARGLLPEEGRDRFEVCLDEAIKNAIVHGNRENASLAVIVRVFRDQEGWGVSIQDQGKGFSEKCIPDLDDPQLIWSEQGRGIHLMRHIARAVEYYMGGKHLVLLMGSAGGTPMPSQPAPAAPPASPAPGAAGTGNVEMSLRNGALVARVTLSPSSPEGVDAVFREIQDALKKKRHQLLVLDLSSVPYLSSEAIGKLVALYKTCLRSLTRLRIAGVNDDLAKVLKLMHLDALFPRFSKVDEAVAAR